MHASRGPRPESMSVEAASLSGPGMRASADAIRNAPGPRERTPARRLFLRHWIRYAQAEAARGVWTLSSNGQSRCFYSVPDPQSRDAFMRIPIDTFYSRRTLRQLRLRAPSASDSGGERQVLGFRLADAGSVLRGPPRRGTARLSLRTNAPRHVARRQQRPSRFDRGSLLSHRPPVFASSPWCVDSRAPPFGRKAGLLPALVSGAPPTRRQAA